MQYLFLVWCIFLLTGSYSKTDKVDLQQILHDLSGHWVGTGFTLIAVPSFTDPDHGFDLKLFHSHETLLFSGVRERIRNAGAEEDIFLSSITYFQQVTDISTNEELHVEPGVWFHEPNTTAPRLWRAGNIPHGNSFLAGSVLVKEEKKRPTFENITSLPFPQGFEDQKFFGSPYTAEYENPTLPATMPSKYSSVGQKNVVIFPTEFLKADIEGQNICNTKTIEISSIENDLGGVLNIPFLGVEANVAQVEATFYLEKVKDKSGTIFWQLQYIQEVYLDFPVLGGDFVITWPHVSVATLRKQAGESS